MVYEDKDWRKNTIFLSDGARYMTCEASKKHILMLGMNFIVSAPYSFASASIGKSQILFMVI